MIFSFSLLKIDYLLLKISFTHIIKGKSSKQGEWDNQLEAKIAKDEKISFSSIGIIPVKFFDMLTLIKNDNTVQLKKASNSSIFHKIMKFW